MSGKTNNIILIEDRVDLQCMRHLHLMANVQFEPGCLRKYGYISGAIVTQEAGVWHLRAVHPFRGVADIPAACAVGKVRRLVVWHLDGYPLVKMALHDAWREYCRLFGGHPQFAFMRKLPNGIENGHEVSTMTLLEADWMLGRAVAVGGKGE